MIRINLLGRVRPKAARRPVAVGAALQIALFIAALVGSLGFLWIHWYQAKSDLDRAQTHIAQLKMELSRLQGVKAQVEAFDRQKAVLQQRISVIEELQRNRTGGQELLDVIANTVSRTDVLWLTSLQRKGNALVFEGTAGSINAVANFITQLKRSGYFQQVEIKESKQDERSPNVQVFLFTLMAQFAPPAPGKPAAGNPPGKI